MATKCILISGPPGIGKTTLVSRVVDNLRASNPNLKVQGFLTREIRQGNQRVGFEVVTIGGQRAPLASINNSSLQSSRWPTVGRYHVDVSSFERIALPELQIHEDTDLFVIDEVGKMELFSTSFLPAVLRLLNSNIPILATVPVPKHGRDIPGVERLRNHPGATMYLLNPNNRDECREQVYSHVLDLLSKD
ncbi:hypothetical protein RND81_05G148300 [Saponaria officinalis]|uniref:AAA+ ATPase domain-containing protein n=1 Tax=Saponaria officinalis TaxID=3572 RepID=A0AAW1KXR7_SAPOF